MNLEQFRKITANLPGSIPVIAPGPDHSYREVAVCVTKGVLMSDPREITPYVGDDPSLYGLASNVIVATRTGPVVEIR